MKKLSMIVIGAGGRGRTYTGFANKHPDMYEVVGVAEPLDVRREYIIKRHPKAAEHAYTHWKDILAVPKFADIAIISTMDRMHMEPALKAIELGYDLLLEKPIAPTPEECKVLVDAAEKKGTRILVCHVLRYTNFFRALKKFIDSGKLGRVMSIVHTEGVGNLHQSHSFVRGNWHNSEESSFMLLQKSCHDLDILQWLIGKECKRVQSFGSLSYFTAANRPEGAPDYCLDGCPKADTCRFHAKTVYLGTAKTWMRNAVCENPEATDEEVLEALKRGRFGRCVFACDNDVVDHQVVNMEFEDDITVTFSMNAFNPGGRDIRIMGTEGELIASMSKPIAYYTPLSTAKTEEINLIESAGDESIAGGHGGGDTGIMFALHDLVSENKASESVCPIRTAYKNHLIAFAAEESRHTGKVVSLDEYESRVK